MLGRISRGLDAMAAVRLWSEGGAWQQKALLSCGGPGAGSIWSMVPSGPEFVLYSAPFRLQYVAQI